MEWGEGSLGVVLRKGRVCELVGQFFFRASQVEEEHFCGMLCLGLAEHASRYVPEALNAGLLIERAAVCLLFLILEIAGVSPEA